MAIRIRVVDGITVALCAARSMPQDDDLYLDDCIHNALADKFSRDWNGSLGLDIPHDTTNDALVHRLESNNPNRDEWDKTYGNAIPDSDEE